MAAAERSGHRFEDYPFDPKADMLMQQGLDRLRAIQDRALARYLWELWVHVKEPSERERESERRQIEERDIADLESMTDKALEGVYGAEAKSLAARVVQPHRNAVTMRRLRVSLSNLGERRKSG